MSGSILKVWYFYYYVSLYYYNNSVFYFKLGVLGFTTLNILNNSQLNFFKWVKYMLVLIKVKHIYLINKICLWRLFLIKFYIHGSILMITLKLKERRNLK